jgi:hypothetical protein
VKWREFMEIKLETTKRSNMVSPSKGCRCVCKQTRGEKWEICCFWKRGEGRGKKHTHFCTQCGVDDVKNLITQLSHTFWVIGISLNEFWNFQIFETEFPLEALRKPINCYHYCHLYVTFERQYCRDLAFVSLEDLLLCFSIFSSRIFSLSVDSAKFLLLLGAETREEIE